MNSAVFTFRICGASNVVTRRPPAEEPLTIDLQEKGEIALRKAFADLNYRDETVAVLLPASLCFALPVGTELLSRRASADELSYAIEPRVPWAAEDMVTSFVQLETGSRFGIGVSPSLAIIALVEVLQNLLADLEAAVPGIQVELIAPEALMAFQHLRESIMAKGPFEAVLWEDAFESHLFTLKNGRLNGWQVVRQASDLPRQLLLFAEQEEHDPPPRLATIGASSDTGSELASLAGWELVVLPAQTLADASEREASRILRGEVDASVNLRTGRLSSPEPLRRIATALATVVVAALFFFLAIAASFFVRGATESRVVNDQEQRQASLFAGLFPNQPLPLNVMGRLRSEERRLAGLNGREGNLDLGPSALRVLAMTLSSLPNDLRFRILEVRIDGGTLYLDGETRTHGDAEKLVSALRDRTDFGVEAPRSEARADGRIAFTVAARLGLPASGRSR